MERDWKPYLVIVSYSLPPTEKLRDVLDLLSDGQARAIAFDPKAMFAVIGVMWNRDAFDLWHAIGEAGGMAGIRETQIISTGTDWCAGRDRPAAGWLVRHLGDPGRWADFLKKDG